jgi:hypothetical protein
MVLPIFLLNEQRWSNSLNCRAGLLEKCIKIEYLMYGLNHIPKLTRIPLFEYGEWQ